jgi:glutamine synthetase
MVSPREDDARQYVLRTAKENDVKFIRLWFTDILGNLKGFAITDAELEGALKYGMAFDGSTVAGFARLDESDMVAMPDPTTFSTLPWRPRQNAVARMFCDVLRPDGTSFEGDPRFVLKQALERASDLGYTFQVGPEMENFYFKSATGPLEPIDVGGYFDLTSSLDGASDLRRDTVLSLEEMGIPVEYSHHEVAGGQHEIDLRHTDALTMADTVMTYRQVVKEVAQGRGVYATFMPKPLEGQNGSGMHVHMSLSKGEDNAFYDSDDADKLSETAKRFIAGLLRHSPEIACVCNQWVNSYKRLMPGFEAPSYVSWATVNRSDLVRVPSYRPGREASVRIEYRQPDPACNPYLAFAAILTAGLAGIEEGYETVPKAEADVTKMTDNEREALGIVSLPGSLYEALLLAEQSEVLRRALGEHTYQSLLRNKRIEWDDYRAAVTDFELKRYFQIL